MGGLLALSRAFGDAYMKGSLQFEGRAEGSDGYSSGFGVVAEPYLAEETLNGVCGRGGLGGGRGVMGPVKEDRKSVV